MGFLMETTETARETVVVFKRLWVVEYLSIAAAVILYTGSIVDVLHSAFVQRTAATVLVLSMIGVAYAFYQTHVLIKSGAYISGHKLSIKNPLSLRIHRS
jgi:hypothetical protein